MPTRGENTTVDPSPSAVVGGGLELEYPLHIVGSAPGLEHSPFALWIVDAHRPRVIVELCVAAGNTYCAFLQATSTLNLATTCSGFDLGVDDCGPAGLTAFEALKAYHDPLYGAFSALYRSSIKDARQRFPDRSIDLLKINASLSGDHIHDGLDDWLPKMSARGVILVEGIEAQPRDSKIKRFWSERAPRDPSFVFTHGQGLGVIYAGGEPLSGRLRALLETREARDITGIRTYFSRLGTSVAERAALRQAETNVAVLSSRAVPDTRASAVGAQSAAAQRDVLTKIVRQQSLTVIALDQELNSPLGRWLVLRAVRSLLAFLKRVLPLSVRRAIRRLLPINTLSHLARNAPAGLKRHVPLSLKQFLVRRLPGG